jgi:hypothetical protein
MTRQRIAMPLDGIQRLGAECRFHTTKVPRFAESKQAVSRST